MHLPKPNEGGSFTPPPAGTFPAVCYRVIDLGTQDTTFKGEPSRKHKIMISWELHDDDANTEDGHPMSISHFYTWSMHDKSTLRKHLEAWRGKRFEDKDFGEGGFNIKKLRIASGIIPSQLVLASYGSAELPDYTHKTNLACGHRPDG